MKAVLLGRRAGTLQRFRVLLFEDRMEEVEVSFGVLEVRRLFFDEVQSATVQARRRWLEAAAGFLLTAVLALIAIGTYAGPTRPVSVWFGAFAVAAAALTALGLAVPRHFLVVHAPEQRMQVWLSRWAGRRERKVARLTRAIAQYQERHAPPPAVRHEPMAS